MTHFRKFHEYDWGAGKVQFLIATSIIFPGTIALEAVVTSLMAQVTPPKLEKTVFNCGLLATLIGAIGRFMSDSMITMAGLMHSKFRCDLVNAIYFPLLAFTALVILSVLRNYKILMA